MYLPPACLWDLARIGWMGWPFAGGALGQALECSPWEEQMVLSPFCWDVLTSLQLGIGRGSSCACENPPNPSQVTSCLKASPYVHSRSEFLWGFLLLMADLASRNQWLPTGGFFAAGTFWKPLSHAHPLVSDKLQALVATFSTVWRGFFLSFLPLLLYFCENNR